MADPKIKYDIEAAVSGSADVIALANHVEKLAGSLDGDLKAKALAAADSLRELGRQDAVLSQFANLRNSVEQTATQLTVAQRASAALGFEISASVKPTATQAGELQKLKESAKSLEVQLGSESVALQHLGSVLSASGVNTNSFVSEQIRLKNALADVKTESSAILGSVSKVGDESAKAGQKINDAFRVLGIRSAEELKAEIVSVRSAMETIRSAASQAGTSLEGAFSAGESKVRALERELRQVSGTMTTADKAASLFKNSLGQIAAGNVIADGVGYMVGKVKDLGAAFIETIVQTQQLRKGLNAVYKDTSIAGTQFDFLKKTAQDAGVSVGGISQAFLKFSASTKLSGISLADSNAVFKALIKATSSLGLSADDAAGSLNALGQMASKGVVQMEELRGQLGDRLPGVLGIVAQSFGITELQLTKLIEAGGLATRDFIPAFTRGLKTLDGETDGLTNSWANLKNAFTSAAQGAGDSGWTQILSGGLKGVAGILGLVVVTVASFSEGIILAGKSVVAFSTFLTGGKDALGFVTEEAAKTKTRLNELINVFMLAAGVVPSATVAQEKHIESLKTTASAALKAIAGIGDLGKAQEVQAFASKLAANSTLAHGDKIVQLNVFVEELLATQAKQIESSHKLVAASKVEGETLIQLAELSGNETKAIEARVQAAVLLVATTTKGLEAQQAELSIMIVRRAELEKERILSGLKKEDYVAELKLLDDKILKSKAEMEQAKQSASAAEKDLLVRKQAAIIYQDNAKNVEFFTAALAKVNAEMLIGSKRQSEMNELKQKASIIEGQLRDALGDSIKFLERESQAKSATLNVDLSRINVAQKHAETMAQEMRLSGNIAAATYYEIEAKQQQIAAIRVTTEVKKLELDTDVKVIEIERLKLTSTGDLRKAEEQALDIKLKVIQAKRLELDLSTDVIRGLENEINAIRNGNSARGTEVEGRRGVVSAVNNQIDAMDRLMMKYTMSANYTERQIALLEREADASEKAAAAENKRLGIDRDKFSVDKDGKRIEGFTPNHEYLFNLAKNRGVTDQQADKLAAEALPKLTGLGGSLVPTPNAMEEFHKAIDEMLRAARAQAANQANSTTNATSNTTNTTTANPANTSANPSSTAGGKVVNLHFDGAIYPVETNNQGASNLIKMLQAGARNAGR